MRKRSRQRTWAHFGSLFLLGFLTAAGLACGAAEEGGGLGRIDAGHAALAKATDNRGSTSAIEEQARVSALVELAREHNRRGDHASAERYSREAIRLGHALPQGEYVLEIARQSLADALVARGPSLEAERFLRDQLVDRQLNRELWVQRVAKYYSGHADNAAALALLRDEVRRLPLGECPGPESCYTGCSYLVREGRILRDIGSKERAVDAFAAAASLVAGGPYTGCEPEAATELGRTLRALGRSDEAEAAYRSAIEFWGKVIADPEQGVSPEHVLPEILDELAALLLSSSRAEESRALTERSRELRSRNHPEAIIPPPRTDSGP